MICESHDCSLNALSIFMRSCQHSLRKVFLLNCKSDPVMLKHFDKMLSKWKALHFIEQCYKDFRYSKFETQSGFRTLKAFIFAKWKHVKNSQFSSCSHCSKTAQMFFLQWHLLKILFFLFFFKYCFNILTFFSMRLLQKSFILA